MVPSPHGDPMPQGRTVTEHGPNWRPVDDHRINVAHAVAASFIVGSAVSQFGQQSGSMTQLHGAATSASSTMMTRISLRGRRRYRMKHLHPIDLGVHNLTCMKLCFKSRKVARRAARLFHGEHKTPYRCGDHWHVGGLSPAVIRGRMSRDQVYTRKTV